MNQNCLVYVSKKQINFVQKTESGDTVQKSISLDPTLDIDAYQGTIFVDQNSKVLIQLGQKILAQTA